MMAEKFHGADSPQGCQGKGRRAILKSTKKAWIPLNEQLPPGMEGDIHGSTNPTQDFKQESIRQWLDSGFFVSLNEKFQQGIDHPVFLHEQGMAQMTVKDYMRSLHPFPETPTLSRATSFNSCHSAASIPQSIPEWLEFWEKDPVEILLDLGFGVDEPDICTQIPARFLGYGSAAKGIDIPVFLEAQKQRMDFETPNLYGRFQQLEILDHVTNAFTSLLNDVNILQKKAEEKNEGNVSITETKEHQRKMSELLRRASKQSIRRDCSPETLESLKTKDGIFNQAAKPGACRTELLGMASNHSRRYTRPLTKHRTLQACDDSPLCHPPQALQHEPGPVSSRLAQKTPPSSMPDGPVKDRTPKEYSTQTSTFKTMFHLANEPLDSFEMEEVQSFEEDAGHSLDMISGTSGTGVNRTNSCQSDSSGFLEEPPEPLPLQIPLLPSSQSLRNQSRGLAPSQDCQQESDESDTKSMVSTSISSQDWSVLEEKTSVLIEEEETQLGILEDPPELLIPDMISNKTTAGRAHLGKGTPMPYSEHKVVGGAATSTYDCPLGFTVSHSTEVKDGFLKPEATGKVPVESHCASPRSPETEHAQDEFLHVDSEASREENSQVCSDINSTVLTLENPPQLLPRLRDVASHTDNYIQGCDEPNLSPGKLAEETPQAKTMYSTLDQISSMAEAEMGNISPNADSNSGKPRSVTIHMPSNLMPAAQSTVALGIDSIGTALECTMCDPITSTGPGLRTEARQSRDASIQTYLCEPGAWHCCACSSNKTLAHGHKPLTKSVSLDAGFPNTYSVGTCHGTPVHCCICCHHRSHCYTQGSGPGPTPQAYRHHPHSHSPHPEVEFMKTLKVLQDTAVRELCACTVQEMETMQTVCQSFREHLEEIEQHLKGQQEIFSRDMSEEEREEARQLQALRKALRQQVEELEFQLGDRAQQIREGILSQLELFTGEPSETHTDLYQCNWTGGTRGLMSIHPAMAPRAAFSRDGGQQAPSSGFAQVESDTRMSLPSLAPAEWGLTPLSNCPAGEKDTTVFL
ncbi:PREDICTED: coiled-coil domain-containing protein 129 [Chrysochloris asiatica]|uniref:Coiled-coil domain-containing protein 129 n=1 Tax=Chrysochloris asiatica TaxID=185453 RepID=A0A9B0T0F7_CHRAS|nr:PREDICTED: coiled-coil domain-containing protein 129 [Chrysochloris asiatica]